MEIIANTINQKNPSQAAWLTPVTPANWEAEIVMCKVSPGKKLARPYSNNKLRMDYRGLFSLVFLTGGLL
jgi:hypothetical protein